MDYSGEKKIIAAIATIDGLFIAFGLLSWLFFVSFFASTKESIQGDQDFFVFYSLVLLIPPIVLSINLWRFKNWARILVLVGNWFLTLPTLLSSLLVVTKLTEDIEDTDPLLSWAVIVLSLLVVVPIPLFTIYWLGFRKKTKELFAGGIIPEGTKIVNY